MTAPLNPFHQDLLHQQWLQEQHDRANHADLFGMINAERLKHYHLHFSKYLSAIHEKRGSPEEQLKPVIVDALLIALAAANTLKLNLGLSIAPITRSGEDSAQALSEGAFRMAEMEVPILAGLSSWLVDRLLGEFARLAAALEKGEHFEDLDTACQARLAVSHIARHLIVAAGALRLDIPMELIARRQRIRQAGLFTGLDRRLTAEPFPRADPDH